MRAFQGGVPHEQSRESPVQAPQDGESSGDPDSQGGVGTGGSVGLMNEKW